MSKKCIKCGYVRNDDLDKNTPDYECPQCGVIYAKAGSTPPPDLRVPSPLKQKNKTSGKLKPCPVCGHSVSKTAEACPSCGAVIKKKTGCLGYIGAIFVVLFGLGVIGGYLDKDKDLKKNNPTTVTAKALPAAAGSKIFKESETVTVGYTSYKIRRSWWSDKLSDNKHLDEKPNAHYLFVDLIVRNNDKKERIVPPLKLIDENGSEYGHSTNAWRVKGAIKIIQNLNPGVSKTGFMVFDVPKGKTYRIKLSGGYWSKDAAYVAIKPN